MKGAGKTTGKMKGKERNSVCVCVHMHLLSQVQYHAKFLALEGGLTNEEMEAQSGTTTSWEEAHPGFKMRTFLSLIS